MSQKPKVAEDATMSVGSGAVPSLTNPTDAYALQKDRYKKNMTKMLRRRKPKL
jgi:hypothetical protein